MNTILQSYLTPGALNYRLALLLDSHQQSSTFLPLPHQNIDITGLVLTQGIPSLRALAKEASVEKPQVWRLQADLVTAQQVAMLESIAQLVLKFEPVKGWNDPNLFMVHVRYSRTWEHVERETVLYDHGKILVSEIETIPKNEAVSVAPVSTFDLSLSAAQKEKKDALDLPHLRLQKQAPIAGRSILAEDFGDEDPDADLDI